MPDYCDAPHCRKSIKTNEERAWCSLCSRVMHKKCQQHVIKVEDIRICFYCNLSPHVTVKTVERLKEYFTEKIEEKKKRMEKEKNMRKNIDHIIIKDVTDVIKDTKITANMINVAKYTQQLNTNVVEEEQKANKAQEIHPRNPFNENNGGNDNDMIAIIKKKEDRNQRNAINENTRLKCNDKTMAVKIDADKTPRKPFSEDMQENDYDKTTMMNMQDADKTFGNMFSENMQEKGRNDKMKTEIRKNKESIDTEFQYITNKQDGNDIQKYIPSCNRRSGIDSKTQDKDRKPTVAGHKIENTLKDHDNRSFSNIEDAFKMNDTKNITKNESQAKLQEDILKVLETVNSQNRLLENLFANDIRSEKPKNQNSYCNIM